MDDIFILTLSCRDGQGIVAAVAGFIARHEGFIIESAQFGDASTGLFFLRMEFSMRGGEGVEALFEARFQPLVAERYEMDWRISPKAHKARLVIFVSKYGHCLNDLLYRHRFGLLPVEIPAIISNHADFASLAAWHHIPFHHLPVRPGEKAVQEAQIIHLLEETGAEVVALARYMQILSPEFCAFLDGRAINIHHSFLPSFKGARPYAQAYERGVKLIGATAHYVTTDLDEGPIIEQEVTRVDHTLGPQELEAAGRDIECTVLARALQYHIARRVLRNGGKTVVFR